MKLRLEPCARLALVLALSLAGGSALAQSGAAPAQPQAQTGPQSLNAAPPPEAPAEEAAEPGSAEQPDADTTAKINLPNVNVQGKRNVFNENDKKLKQLQDSLPCAGCDAKPHTKRKLVKRVLDAVGERVLPTEAPDHSTRDPNDKAADLVQEHSCSAGNIGGCIPDNAKP